jgi:26S proteasome regulatory subunit N8
MIKSLSIQTNNSYLVLYLGWLVRTVISLHKLINNKIALKEEDKQPEKKDDKKKEESKESTEKENKESKEKESKK